MSQNHLAALNLQFMHNTPRQRHFLAHLLPALYSEPWLKAIWLSGSFARGDADRWSDLNLHLLVDDDRAATLQADLTAILDGALPLGWHHSLEAAELIKGLTFVENGLDAHGGVAFDLRWTDLGRLQNQLERYRPLRLLFAHPALPADLYDFLSAPRPALSAPDAEIIAATLAYFWVQLARLPAALNRGEDLAAQQLVAESRRALTDLVVALNGAHRPASVARINQYLGPAQLDAFQKTLPAAEITPALWIGQAVALIVLYRWYAPQLVEIYGVAYPHALERTALALLSGEVQGWPALIRTG